MINFAYIKLCNILILKKKEIKMDPKTMFKTRSFLDRFCIVFGSFVAYFFCPGQSLTKLKKGECVG